MRIDIPRWLISIFALPLIACSPAEDDRHKFVSGYIAVHEMFWAIDHDTPYPFTTSGEISCVYYPEFGTEVYFEPEGYSKDSSIGTPLNQAAAESLKKDDMITNVPYSIQKGANLSEAVEIGLRACDKIHGEI